MQALAGETHRLTRVTSTGWPFCTWTRPNESMDAPSIQAASELANEAMAFAARPLSSRPVKRRCGSRCCKQRLKARDALERP